jgi:hypothetical protein
MYILLDERGAPSGRPAAGSVEWIRTGGADVGRLPTAVRAYRSYPYG